MKQPSRSKKSKDQSSDQLEEWRNNTDNWVGSNEDANENSARKRGKRVKTTQTLEEVQEQVDIGDLKTEAKKYSVTASKKEVNLARAFLNVKDQEFVFRNLEKKVETERLKEFIQNKLQCKGILLLHDVDYLQIRNLEIRSSGRTPSKNQLKDVIVVTFSCAPIFFHNKIVLDEEKVLDYKMSKDTAKEEELNQANIEEIKEQPIEAGKRKRKERNVESDNTDAYDDIINVLEAEIESLNHNGGSNLLGLPIEEIKNEKEKILKKFEDVKDYVIFQKQKYGEIDEDLLEVRRSIEENEEKQLKIKNKDTKSKKEREKNDREKNDRENERTELILQKEDLEMIGKLDYTAMQDTLLQPVNDKVRKNHILFSIQFLDWRRVVEIGTTKNEIKVTRNMNMNRKPMKVSVRRTVSKFNAYTLEEIPLELQDKFIDGATQQSTIDNDNESTIVEDNYGKFRKDWNGVDKNERDEIFEKESDESWESYIERIEREKMSKEDVRLEPEEVLSEDDNEVDTTDGDTETKNVDSESDDEDIPLSDNTDSDDSDDSDFPKIIMNDVDDNGSDDDFPDIVL